MTFATRIGPAVDFEQSLIGRYCCSGWNATPFGQALLKPDARAALTQFHDLAWRPTLIRWMPDILIWRESRGAISHLALIDAKTSTDANRDSLNHAIEIAAIDAMNVYVESLYTPAFFVFDDLTVVTPREAKLRGLHFRARSSNGSGTSYLLVPKCYALPFDTVFPRWPDDEEL